MVQAQPAPSNSVDTNTTPSPSPVNSDQVVIEPKVQKSSILKPVTDDPVTETNERGKPMNKLVIVGLFLVVLLGIGSGYFLSVTMAGTSGGLGYEPGLKREVSKEEITVGTKVGVRDESTFKDSGEGMLQKGGIDGEGSHHLVRPGGDSQTIYITSSVIDLDQFIGRKVKVWGETIGAQKAGWLMDVGKLEVLE
ncbi:MAG: hypothetical protein ACOX6V_03460 [Patescibacteria group bacterium]